METIFGYFELLNIEGNIEFQIYWHLCRTRLEEKVIKMFRSATDLHDGE